MSFRKHKIAAIGLTAPILLLSSCAPESDSSKSASHRDLPQDETVEEVYLKYNPGAGKAISAGNLTEDRFQPCSNDDEIRAASVKILNRVFQNPEVDEIRISRINKDNNSIILTEVKYHWAPGDPGVVSRAITWYIFSQDCRVGNIGWKEL